MPLASADARQLIISLPRYATAPATHVFAADDVLARAAAARR